MKKLVVLLVCFILAVAIQLQAKEFTLGLSLSTLNNPFFVTLKDGAMKEAEAAGVKLLVTDSQDNPATEAKNIEDLIVKKVDALLINSTVNVDGSVAVTANDQSKITADAGAWAIGAAGGDSGGAAEAVGASLAINSVEKIVRATVDTANVDRPATVAVLEPVVGHGDRDGLLADLLARVRRLGGHRVRERSTGARPEVFDRVSVAILGDR